jgi:hypothetical protein
MKGPLSSQEKGTIREMLDQNHSHNQIAKVMGRSQSTISDFARREGYSPLPERTPTVANAARKEFGKAERMELISLAFMRGEALLNKPDLTPREYKEVMTGIAIGVDKARLEEGQPNSVRETRAGNPRLGSLNLEQMFDHLDRLQEEEDRADSTTDYGSPNPGYPGMQPE